MWLYLLGLIFVIQELLGDDSLSTDPAYTFDPCYTKYLECNEREIRRSPFEKNDALVFNKISELDKWCSDTVSLLNCLSDTEEICKVPHRTVKLSNDRRIVESLCNKKSIWRQWYIDNAYCINYFYLYVRDDCIESAFAKASQKYEHLEFDIDGYMCGFHIEKRRCYISNIHKYCGVNASRVLKKVFMYYGEYEIHCEQEVKYRSYFKPSSDAVTTTEGNMELELENTDLHGTDYTLSYEVSTPTPENIPTSEPDDMKTDQSDPEIQDNEFFTTESFYENPDSFSSGDGDLLDSQYDLFQKRHPKDKSSTSERNIESFVKEKGTSIQDDERFAFDSSKNSHYITKSNVDIISNISEENYSNDFTTFGLYEILDQGNLYYLGCGFAMISRTENYPLKNMYCTWASNTDPEQMFKCSVHITEACLFEEKCDGPSCDVLDLAYETSLLIYVLDNEIYQNKATIKLKYYKPNTNALPPGKISLHAHHPGSDKFDADYRQWKFSVTPNY